MFALYNFFDTDISTPDSYKYMVTNNAKSNALEDAAKIIGKDASSIFNKGIGIPFLYGISVSFKDEYTINLTSFYSDNPSKYYAPSKPYGAVILPNSPNFNSLLYNELGFTFDCWLRIPDLDTWTDDQLHKVLLGNENVGSVTGTPFGIQTS